jgi:uncharacterized protein YndB with AHSA1/START domain
METSTDRIEKKILLRAPLERVWRAISDSKQFGSWHGVEFDGPFIAGAGMVGKVVPTSVAVDPEVARSRKKYEGTPFSISVERIEPMRLFSMRWYPFDEQSGVDYSNEPWTLVEFRLEEVAGGTMLTITESGFDAIPLEQRAKALTSHEQGWAAQGTLIDKYLALAA